MSETKLFKPMLAEAADFATLRFPVYASHKLDGLRCTIHDGRAMSRSMKPIPNRWVQSWVHDYAAMLNGADGELIVGAPNLPDTFRTSTSFIMSADKTDFDFTFHVFDRFDMPDTDYPTRFVSIARQVKNVAGVEIVRVAQIPDADSLLAFEALALQRGYEGVMVRNPAGRYKQGRATNKGQELLKVKRHADMEARVVGFEERQHNGNERFENEIGRGARSSHQAGKTGTGTLGALVVVGVNGPFKDVQFSVGTGFDDDERARVWGLRYQKTHPLAKIKYFPIGAKDAPRHPVFVGWRDPADLS